METRTIKILAFNYTDAEGNWRTAWKGQELELSAEDAARGDADGAFVTDEDNATSEGAAISLDSTDEDLAAFVKDAKVDEVVDAAGGDAELAQRLLSAENDATGNDPRKGVAEGLTAVAGQA